jgi:hypothetical protein
LIDRDRDDGTRASYFRISSAVNELAATGGFDIVRESAREVFQLLRRALARISLRHSLFRASGLVRVRARCNSVNDSVVCTSVQS